MKKIAFTKMVGAGNDFLIVEAPKGINLKKLAIKSCDRTDGLGADGLLVLDRSKKADYKMRIINADGSEAEMCGNGARCMAAYIVKNKKPRKKKFAMETIAGIVEGQAKGEEAIVTLSKPVGYKTHIPIKIMERKINVSYIDTGVPHTIVYVADVNRIDVETIGRKIRYHKRFKPRGTNVDFVMQLSRAEVDCRTYERGVEGETRACGTGVVAAAIVTYLKANPAIQNKKQAKMSVHTKSKETLDVTFDLTDGKIENVKLKGSAKFIAQGQYYLKEK